MVNNLTPDLKPASGGRAALQIAPTGLTTEEARRRLAEVGPNIPAAPRRRTALAQVVLLFSNPLVIILLFAALVSGFVGELINAAIIVVMVALSSILNFVQTYRSQRAAARLRATVGLTAQVLRDGAWSELPQRDVVPGDVIRLQAGALVPADARLSESRDLHVQQAALTGESLPAEKDASAPDDASVAPTEARNAVFLGTSIVSGTATAVVTATGPRTLFGDIAARLVTRRPETEFERGTRQFGLLIMRTVVFLVLFVFLSSAVLRRDPLESFLFAVALAVGLTPEFLPMITTVTLGQGALRMAQQKVIVKDLAAIQNFGSIDVLCSDKTGTLTSGQMEVVRHVDAFGCPNERVFMFSYLNSSFETGIANPVDTAIRRAGAANALDLAILRHDHPNLGGYHKLDEIPFDFERRRLSVVVAHDEDRVLITKGAPESLLPICSAVDVDGAPQALTAADRARAEQTFQSACRDGAHVLAVAYRTVPLQSAYRRSDEHDLVLLGFVTFADPPLDDAATAVHSLGGDGVQVKILTGDNELVAVHVCAAVGLDVGSVVLGSALEGVTDGALGQIAERTTVFARVSPAQKNRIIVALKRRGHVVGYLGDGINDAPSLHAADVGISVASATDVAKDAADIILLESGLPVLHRGILEGRRAFGNVMKYLLMGTSSNFGNMFSMAAATLFLPFLPMLPTQILLNNFLYDLAQVTIPSDNVDPTYMHKPRRWNIGMIRDFMIFIGPISSLYDFLTFGALLTVLHAGPALFHTGWFVESLATQTLVLFVIRTAGNPLRSRPSTPLTATVLLIVAAGLALPFTPLAADLGFVPLPALFFIFLAIATITYLVLVEIVKRRLMRRLF